MKRLSWEPERPPPKHPFRDSVIFYAILAGLIVLVTFFTGGRLLPGEVEEKRGLLKLIGEVGALTVAAAFFVVATGFSWWRWRRAGAGRRT